ncbi:hypothetical protein C8Q78DRAFT_1081770 [Trametes maxima]|nr:hypothetical protein C8Q78DRAFT_1081770 [Trametes maxima]
MHVQVALVMFQETLNCVAPMHTCYYYLVSNYSNPLALRELVWSLVIMPLLSSVLTLTSQIFFARRVSLMGRTYKLLAGFAGACLLTSVALGLASTVKTFQVNTFTKYFADNTQWLSTGALVLSSVADLVLSASIIINIPQSGSEYRKAETRVDMIVLYILNTGLLTGIVHGVCAISAIVLPREFIWASISVIVERLYAITLLSVLNSRTLTVSGGMNVLGPSDPFGRGIIARANHLAEAERWNVPRVPNSGPTTIDIKISAEVEVDAQSEMVLDRKTTSGKA